MMFHLFLTKRVVPFQGVCLFLSICFYVFAYSDAAAQEPPTVTVSFFSGQVMVSVQGQAPKVAAVGDVLRAGDKIVTLVGAEVVLTLTEGSELHLGEKTKIDIAELTQSRNGARQSNVKLLNGRVRAFLTPGHQEKGSAFTIETPNTTAGVKFSRPVLEITYDPTTDTTTIDAYTVDVIITNLRSMRVEQIHSGQRAVIQAGEPLRMTNIRDSSNIQETSVLSALIEEPDETPPAPINQSTLLQSRNSVRQATGVVPSSIGTVGSSGPEETGDDGGGSGGNSGTGESGGAGTGSPPGPGSRPERPERQRRIISIQLNNM